MARTATYNTVRKLVTISFLFMSVYLPAQQIDSDYKKLKLDSLNRVMDSTRQVNNEIVVASVGRYYESIDSVKIELYCQGKVRVRTETNKNGFCRFAVNGYITVDSVVGRKGIWKFEYVGGTGKNYILRNDGYRRKSGVAIRPH